MLDVRVRRLEVFLARSSRTAAGRHVLFSAAYGRTWKKWLLGDLDMIIGDGDERG